MSRSSLATTRGNTSWRHRAFGVHGVHGYALHKIHGFLKGACPEGICLGHLMLGSLVSHSVLCIQDEPDNVPLNEEKPAERDTE